jgi:hypothetical protein
MIKSMVNKHTYSFFGQNIALIIKSNSKYDNFLFIKCIKRKSNGKWEKFTEREGKIIKCSLEEIMFILCVLNHQIPSWQNFHIYKDEKTVISLGWEENNNQILWFNIANYSKMLNFAEIEILKLLLIHIIKEKIIFSTIPHYKNTY